MISLIKIKIVIITHSIIINSKIRYNSIRKSISNHKRIHSKIEETLIFQRENFYGLIINLQIPRSIPIRRIGYHSNRIVMELTIIEEKLLIIRLITSLVVNILVSNFYTVGIRPEKFNFISYRIILNLHPESYGTVPTSKRGVIGLPISSSTETEERNI